MLTTGVAEQRRALEMAVDEAYDSLREHHIDERRLVFIKEGSVLRGAFGVVRQALLYASPYLPTWLSSRRYGEPQLVAVKQLRISDFATLFRAKRAFTRELLVMSRVKGHPGVVQFLGFYADLENSKAWIIMPWEPNGNVSEFVKRRDLEVPERLSLVYDTIDALVFLHQLDPPVCHGDIKAANVLINSKFRAVLCDLALSRIHEDSGFGGLYSSSGDKGSVRWCSPEIIEGASRAPTSDIYAWAWLVWEIMTGEIPYKGTSNDYAIILRIFESPLPQVDGESRLSDCLPLWELMTRCWNVDPQQRPTSAMCKTTVKYLPHCPPTSNTADPHARSAVLLENLGDLESWKGDHKAAFAFLDQALHLYQREGNDKGIASVLRIQSAVALRDSNPAKAMKTASAALEKCRNLGDTTGVADSLHKLGCSFLMENSKVDARRSLQESSEIFRAQGDRAYLARCLSTLGELYRREGQDGNALAILEEAVDIASHCGDRLGEASALMVLGSTYRTRDQAVQAFSTLVSACGIAKNIGWNDGLSTCLCRLGEIKLQQGMHSEAEELILESVGVARRSNAGLGLGQALGQLGRCLRAQGRHEEAISALEESFSIYQNLALGFEPDVAGVATLLANLKSAIGDREGALAWSDRAIVEWRKGGDKLEISRCLAMKGVHLMEMKRYDEGALHLEASLVIDQELRDEDGVRWNRRRLSRIPKVVITWEVRRRARLAVPKAQSLRTTSLLCDLKKLQRRVPQLMTPGLKSLAKPSNGGGI